MVGLSRAGDDQPKPFLWRSPIRRGLAVIGLTGFAITQPLLTVFGDNPSTLSFHQTSPAEVVALAMLVGLIPPLLLIAATTALGWLNRTAGRIAHLVVVAALATMALIQWMKALDVPAGIIVLAIALIAGIGFTIGYLRFPLVTAWTSYTAFLPLLAVGMFLVASPSSALLHTAAAPDRVSSDAPSVVMIVLDELPTRSLVNADGQLDAARYPNLATFADDATWYRHHTSQASFTEQAVPSLLTGDEPRTDWPIASSYPDNLFTLLAPTHELEVMEAVTRLCPYKACPPEGADTGPGFGHLLGLARDVWVERITPSDPGPTALDDFNEEVTAVNFFVPNDEQMLAKSVRADAFRATFDADDPTSLYYLHLVLPHQPWRFYPDGTLYRDSDPLSLDLPEGERFLSHTWSESNSIVDEQRSVLQTQYVDALLGQILGDLQATGLYDDSLIVITADHGISFELHTPSRQLAAGASSEDTLDALAYTPLLVKLPGQTTGQVDDSNVMSIDVLPTIAEAVGVELPFEVDGVPIGSPGIAERGDRKWFHDIPSTDGEPVERGVVEYEDQDQYATVPDRGLGPLSDEQDPLSAMHDRLSVQDVIGVPLSALSVSGGPAGTLELGSALEQLEHPTEAPLGVVSGRVGGDGGPGVVLLAVDGTVVAGSEISTPSDGVPRVVFLLPQGVLDEENTIEAVLVTGGTYRTLELTRALTDRLGAQ